MIRNELVLKTSRSKKLIESILNKKLDRRIEVESMKIRGYLLILAPSDIEYYDIYYLLRDCGIWGEFLNLMITKKYNDSLYEGDSKKAVYYDEPVSTYKWYPSPLGKKMFHVKDDYYCLIA